MDDRLSYPPSFQHHQPPQLSPPSMSSCDSVNAAISSVRIVSGPGTPLHPHQGHNPHPSQYNQYSAASISRGPPIDQPLPSPSTSAQHLSVAQGGVGSAHKRAYRQRRKDPSCDACRERKVKCDATDSSSCSECHSRNVKCQFTKETNRRMSSMKLVQDLEKQLAQAKATIASLRSQKSKIDSNDAQPNIPLVLELNSVSHRRSFVPVGQHAANAREHIRNYCHGVFKLPPQCRHLARQVHSSPHPPQLPEHSLAEQLLDSYLTTVHSYIPILHWPTFLGVYQRVYQKGDLSGEPPSWGSLLFAVFACGLLYTLDPKIRTSHPDNGLQFIRQSHQLTDLFNDEFTVDHARTALLTSIFLMEINCKSASWTWLGSTVRIAQDIGLHRDSGPWGVVENELRRRIWWGIYVWDRLLSVELGRVLLINDDDCNIGLPCSVEDQFITDRGPQQSPNILLCTIHLVQLIGPLLQSLNSIVISPLTLHLFDSHFTSCMRTFPPNCHINNASPLEPRYLHLICHLQNNKLVLHRHNLSTSCSPDLRAAAMESCVNTSKETATLLERLMRWTPNDNPGSPQTWQSGLAKNATAMLCTHIWRCTLFLLYSGRYGEALTCIKVSTVIGETRAVNQACGRYLCGFINVLSEKKNIGELDTDGGLLAIASGDVQGSESSWIWGESETEDSLNDAGEQEDLADGPSQVQQPLAPARMEYLDTIPDHRSAPASAPEESSEWSGWADMEWRVKDLMQRRERYDPTMFRNNSRNGNLSDVSHDNGTCGTMGISSLNSIAGGASRISIANII